MTARQERYLLSSAKPAGCSQASARHPLGLRVCYVESEPKHNTALANSGLSGQIPKPAFFLNESGGSAGEDFMEWRPMGCIPLRWKDGHHRTGKQRRAEQG